MPHMVTVLKLEWNTSCLLKAPVTNRVDPDQTASKEAV